MLTTLVGKVTAMGVVGVDRTDKTLSIIELTSPPSVEVVEAELSLVVSKPTEVEVVEMVSRLAVLVVVVI